MSDDRKDLPSPDSPNFLARVREVLSTYLGKRGDTLDRGVTLRDLVEADIVTLRPGYRPGASSPIGGVGGAVGTGGTTDEPDLTPPPIPSTVTITPAFAHIVIECAEATYPQGHGHQKTRVYGATYTQADVDNDTMPAFMDAVLLTEFTGTIFAHPTSLGVMWRLWLTWVSNDNVEGPPAGGAGGFDAVIGKIGTSDLGPLIIEAGNIKAGAVTAAKFAAGLSPVTIVTSVPTSKLTDTIFNTTDKKLYYWNGTAYELSAGGAASSINAADIVGLISAAQIASLAASQITGSLTNAQIADLAASKLTGQITATQITDGAISTPKLAAGSVTTAKLVADAITANELAANAVTTAKLAAGAVTTAKLTAGAVTANELAAGSVVAGKIAALSITGSEIAAGSVNADRLVANSITAGQIQAGAISATELAAGAVTATKIAANAIAVGSAAIQDGAIVNAMIANATIDSAKIANLSVAKLTAGSLAAGQYVQSSNYVAGVQGWRINADGTAELGAASIRGGVTASTLSAATGSLGDITLGGLLFNATKTNYNSGTGVMLGYYSTDGNSYFGVTKDLGGGVVKGMWMSTSDGVMHMNGALISGGTVDNSAIPVSELSKVVNGNTTSGARVEITNNRVSIYNSSNQERVRLSA